MKKVLNIIIDFNYFIILFLLFTICLSIIFYKYKAYEYIQRYVCSDCSEKYMELFCPSCDLIFEDSLEMTEHINGNHPEDVNKKQRK